MHVYDFITDETQYDIKRSAANGMQVFESKLRNYKKLFFEEFNIMDSTGESKYLHESLKKNEVVGKWFIEFENLVKSDLPTLTRLFEDIEEVYQIFLGGDFMSAVIYFRHLLTKYDLLDESYSDVLGGFVRGRYYLNRDEILEESYFYHIPFFNRYLISNQRFSFSGHPLLYAGQSLIAVFFELSAKSLDDEKIATCLLAFDHFAHFQFGDGWERIRPRNKIYDISNEIHEIVNDTFFRLIEFGIAIPAINSGPGFPKERILRNFRKFILSHCCTFPKGVHEGYDSNGKMIIYDRPHFVEEYALPQLLTQAVKLLGYNGIIYPSTKFVGKEISVTTNWHSHIYRTNIAMFTEYKVVDNKIPFVDKELFEILKIETLDFNNLRSVGLGVDVVKEFDAEAEGEKFLKVLKEFDKFVRDKIPVSEISRKIVEAIIHIEKKVTLYHGMKIEGRLYFRSLAGKMELIYLIQYYRFIRSQFYKLYSDEIANEDF